MANSLAEDLAQSESHLRFHGGHRDLYHEVRLSRDYEVIWHTEDTKDLYRVSVDPNFRSGRVDVL